MEFKDFLKITNILLHGSLFSQMEKVQAEYLIILAQFMEIRWF